MTIRLLQGDALHFHVGLHDDACQLVESFHYSGRFPSNIQCIGTWHKSGGLFGDRGDAVAACVFSIPPTRWSEEVLELSRLVRRDDVSCSLSGLISLTVRAVRRIKKWDLLVSFADWTHEHHGGVYQASSWHFAGKRARRLDGILLDGAYVGGRACNHRYGTRSPTKLRERLGERIEPHFDEGKFLYWLPIGKSGLRKAARLGLGRFPYPKPRTDVEPALREVLS